MIPRSLSAVTRVAVAAVGAAALSACASRGGSENDPRGTDSPFVVSSSHWITGGVETPELGATAVRTPPKAPNAALRPDDPWLGTIGVRGLLSEHSEIGVGVAVPNPFPEYRDSSLPGARTSLGLSVWLSFGF